MTNEEVTSQPLPDGDVDELRLQVDKLIQLNYQKQQAMAEETQRGIDPLNFAHARITAITQLLLNEEQQLKLEVLTQTLISTMVDAAWIQAAKEKEDEDSLRVREELLRGMPGH